MSDVRLAILAATGVGLAGVSAWMHINGRDGCGWGFAAFVTWVCVLAWA